MFVEWLLGTIGFLTSVFHLPTGVPVSIEFVPADTVVVPLAPAADVPLVPESALPYLVFSLFLAVIGAVARTIGWARAASLDRIFLAVAMAFGWGGFVLTLEYVLLFAPLSYLLAWLLAGRFAGVGGGGVGTLQGGAGDGQKSAMGQGSDDAVDLTELDTEPPDHDFDAVGGMESLKDTLDDRVIQPLADPEKYDQYGIGAVNGVLFHGPPGCGKTFVASAVAGETEYNYLEVTPTEITSRYVGEAADNVAKVFEVARENEPCLVFIDEIDAIAGDRSGRMNTSEQQMVNQLLVELESQADSGVVVFAATNYVEDVDDAILRSGRFDERIEVPPPDRQARTEILGLQLSEAPSELELDYEGITAATAGFASSDVELLAEVASRHAIAEDAPIGQRHLRQALEETETSIPGWLDEYEDRFDEDLGRGSAGETPQRLDAIPGMEAIAAELTNRVLDPVRNADRYERVDLDTVDGALLYGPPDCGKTTLARSIAAELDRNVIELSPARLRREGVRDAADRTAEIVEDARSGDPSVLLLDDLDDLTPRSAASGEYRRVASQLESLLPSLAPEDALVVGTAGAADAVDVDVLHCGVFDERIEVPPPEPDTRIAVLRDTVPEHVFAEEIDWQRVAAAMDGFTVRDIRYLGGTVAREALREEQRITTDDLLEAAERTEATLAVEGEAVDGLFGQVE